MYPVLQKSFHSKGSQLINFISDFSHNLANDFSKRQIKKYGYGFKNLSKPNKKSVRKKIKNRKYQRGRGAITEVVRGVLNTLKSASQVAKYSNPKSPFRLAVTSRYGIPNSIMKKMYKYN